jgi:outer membrane lipoprotein-sorting protein
MKTSFLIIFIFAISFFSFSVAINAQKLKAEEIIAKHLDSIGTKENRDAVKNRFAIGLSQFESKLPSLKAAGKAILVSDANNLFFVTSFNSKEYPFEKIGIFAEKVNLPFVSAGARSPLGAFIADHSKILSDGLFSGGISSTWQLLSSESKIERFKSGGTKKIDGRKAYALDYYPSGGSPDFSVRLYFDTETFQHLRTEYIRTIPPKQATFGVLGTQTGVRLELTENFGDFKKAGDLTLPHSYKLQYLSNSNSGVYEFNWVITISEYRFNQKLDDGFFNFDDK